MDKFWMVVMNGPQARTPVVKHPSKNAAIKELSRLSKLTKQDGYIVESIYLATYRPPVEETQVVVVRKEIDPLFKRLY